MSKDERIYIRVTPETKEQLRQAAARENRSISNYLEALIKRELEKKPE